MTGGYLSQAAIFLIDVIFGLYILAVLLRLLFQLVRADFYNPLSQTIVTITNPPLIRMRRYIPSIRGIDTSSVILLIALQALVLWLRYAILGYSPAFLGLLVSAIAALVTKTIYVFIVSIFILVIASWIAPQSYSPILGLLNDLTDPILRPVRRRLPPLGGLDLSPLVVLVGLQLMIFLVAWPLRDFGRSLL